MIHSETSLTFVLEITEASGLIVGSTPLSLEREVGTFAFSNPEFNTCQITVAGAVLGNPARFQLRCPGTDQVVLIGRLNFWGQHGPIGYGTVVKLPVGSLRVHNIWVNGVGSGGIRTPTGLL